MSVRGSGYVRTGEFWSSSRRVQKEINDIRLQKQTIVKPATQKQLDYIEDLKAEYEKYGLVLPIEYERRERNTKAAGKAIMIMRVELKKARKLHEMIYGKGGN